MIEKQGNLLESAQAASTWLVFTANSNVTYDGRLVMGAGIAKTVRDAYPGIDQFFGELLKVNGLVNRRFYLVRNDVRRIIALQTKIDWRDPSPLDLVRESCYCLGQFAYFNHNHTFVMTRPGCGHGGLDWSVVRPCIEQWLPNNVHIYTLEEKLHASPCSSSTSYQQAL